MTVLQPPPLQLRVKEAHQRVKITRDGRVIGGLNLRSPDWRHVATVADTGSLNTGRRRPGRRSCPCATRRLPTEDELSQSRIAPDARIEPLGAGRR
jgi:hypothetical protein